MPTCLYCREEKSEQLFNREHVIPKSFGTFSDNLVLHRVVCKDCNSYFSSDLELHLGRDSMEGFQRYDADVASPDGMRKFGGTRMRCRWRGGELDGALMEWRPSGGALKVFVVDQIGYSTSPDGPREWHSLEDFPSKEALRARGFTSGAIYFQICGNGPDLYARAKQILYDGGFRMETDEHPIPAEVSPDSNVPINIRGTVDQVLMRAMAKIAMNYFAFHFPGIAQMDPFADTRRFVRYGTPSGVELVTIRRQSILGGIPDERQLLVHTVTASWQPARQQVVAQVSLFSWLQYEIVLGHGFKVPPEFVEVGHLFDPINRAILPIARASRVGHRQPPPMRKKPDPGEAI